jgi:hypothetical protein
MTVKHKINSKQMYEFLEKYKTTYVHERLGQAFLNEFFKDRSDPGLFYETNNYKAYQMISTKYVNWED